MTPIAVRRAVTAAVVLRLERETLLLIVADVNTVVVVVVVFILSVPTPDIWTAVVTNEVSKIKFLS